MRGCAVLGGPAPVDHAGLRAFFAAQPDVALAYLFGSQARGDTGPLSDVDLAIVLDGPPEGRPARRDDLAARLMQLLRRNDVDLVLADRAPALLRHRIARGVCLFARDPVEATRFGARALRDKEDTAPLRAVAAAAQARRLALGEFGRPPAAPVASLMARIDRDAVGAHVAGLEEAVDVLRGLSHLSAADLAATERLWTVSHGLQLAIQNVLDVATRLVAALDAGTPPEDYRGALLRLGELGVLPADFANRIAPMAGLRNILVHGYLRLVAQRLVEALRRLDDLAAFAAAVRAFLDANAAL